MTRSSIPNAAHLASFVSLSMELDADKPVSQTQSQTASILRGCRTEVCQSKTSQCNLDRKRATRPSEPTWLSMLVRCLGLIAGMNLVTFQRRDACVFATRVPQRLLLSAMSRHASGKESPPGLTSFSSQEGSRAPSLTDCPRLVVREPTMKN